MACESIHLFGYMLIQISGTENVMQEKHWCANDKPWEIGVTQNKQVNNRDKKSPQITVGDIGDVGRYLNRQNGYLRLKNTSKIGWMEDITVRVWYSSDTRRAVGITGRVNTNLLEVFLVSHKGTPKHKQSVSS